MTERRLLISFSGGETSGLMTKLIYDRMAGRYDKICTVFANTGQENEQTLRFVQKCDNEWGWNVVWVEADVNPEHGEGTKAKVVMFATASRDGQPFEAMIKKYGIPNKAYPHCTRELKQYPIHNYVRAHLGWAKGSYDTAIGIRVDEFDRQNADAQKLRFIYPLIKPFPHKKADVNEFWARNGWRLELKGYQGNCKWCWKKSDRKHFTLITETPEVYAFPERAEKLYATAGQVIEGERRFFRRNRTVDDLRREAAKGKFEPATDDARQYQIEMFDPELDVGDDCEESCEINFEEVA